MNVGGVETGAGECVRGHGVCLCGGGLYEVSAVCGNRHFMFNQPDRCACHHFVRH